MPQVLTYDRVLLYIYFSVAILIMVTLFTVIYSLLVCFLGNSVLMFMPFFFHFWASKYLVVLDYIEILEAFLHYIEIEGL